MNNLSPFVIASRLSLPSSTVSGGGPLTALCQALCISFLGLAACSPAPEPAPQPAPTEEQDPEQATCLNEGSPRLELGTGVGAAFELYEEGSPFTLEFASQSGMAGDISLRAEGIALSDVQEVSCRLLVDGEAIGESITQGDSLRCDEGYARLDTSLPIDVGGHSTVNSVVQLEDQVGELEVILSGENGVITEQSVNVLIRL